MLDAVMILAAGFGSRMGALTADRPKPLIPVAGRALIEHALGQTDEIATRVVNAHYRADQIVAHLSGRAVTVLTEAPEILDSGGGVKAALPYLGPAPFFTLNADAVWAGPNPLHTLCAAWRPGAMRALLLCAPPARVHGRVGGGDFTIGVDGRIAWGGQAVYTGAQILDPALFDDTPDGPFAMRRIWDKAAAQEGFCATIYEGHWADVGHPGGIAAAEEMLTRV